MICQTYRAFTSEVDYVDSSYKKLDMGVCIKEMIIMSCFNYSTIKAKSENVNQLFKIRCSTSYFKSRFTF